MFNSGFIKMLEFELEIDDWFEKFLYGTEIEVSEPDFQNLWKFTSFRTAQKGPRFTSSFSLLKKLKLISFLPFLESRPLWL